MCIFSLLRFRYVYISANISCLIPILQNMGYKLQLSSLRSPLSTAYNEEMKNINNILSFAHFLFARYDLFQQLNKSFMFACAI